MSGNRVHFNSVLERTSSSRLVLVNEQQRSRPSTCCLNSLSPQRDMERNRDCLGMVNWCYDRTDILDLHTQQTMERRPQGKQISIGKRPTAIMTFPLRQKWDAHKTRRGSSTVYHMREDADYMIFQHYYRM